MPLTCSCDWDWEPEPGGWSIDWQQDLDFEPLETSRRKRCKSCGELIDIGSLVIRFECFRYPYTEQESRRHGRDWDDWNEEPWIPKAPIYLCEKCGEIFLNLRSVGFECLYPTENMPDMLNEYKSTYDPQPLNGETKKQKIERLKQRETKRFLKR